MRIIRLSRADQVSGDALGQHVDDLDGTHLVALNSHPQVEVVAGSSRDRGRRERFARAVESRLGNSAARCDRAFVFDEMGRPRKRWLT